MRIFIYGTLKEGFCGHKHIVPYIESEVVKPLGPFKLYGFELRVGIAPFLVRHSDMTKIVIGELYDFYDAQLVRELDEGESWSYRREMVDDNIWSYVAKPGIYLQNSELVGSVYTKDLDNFVLELNQSWLTNG